MNSVPGLIGKLLLSLLLLPAIGYAQESGADVDAITEVVDLYTAGTYEGDGDKLRSVFHENAVMHGFFGDQLLIADPTPFIEAIESAPIKDTDADYQPQIVSIDVDGTAASVTLRETGFPDGMSFTNYFHLIDDGSGWKIISKTFMGTPVE